MKKFILIGLMLITGNVFCQTIKDVPLNEDQEKKVKVIHKQIEKQIDGIIENPQISVEEKKNKIHSLKNDRNTQLSDILLPEQMNTVLSKDPINWDGAIKKVDKNETAKQKAEKEQKLSDVSKQEKDLDKQESDIKKQMKDLEKKQKDIDNQRKVLKQQKKDINNQYK